MSIFNFLHRGKKTLNSDSRVLYRSEDKKGAKTMSVYKVFKNAPEFDEKGNITNAVDLAPLYYASTWEEAEKAAELLLYYDKIEHFAMWGELHKDEFHKTTKEGTDKKDEDQEDDSFEPSINSPEWKAYKSTCITPEDEYYIAELAYTPTDFAQQLRALMGCAPLFIPEEDPKEVYAYMMAHMEEEPDSMMPLPDNVSQAALRDTNVALNVEKTFEKVADFVTESFCKIQEMPLGEEGEKFKMMKVESDGTVTEFTIPQCSIEVVTGRDKNEDEEYDEEYDEEDWEDLKGLDDDDEEAFQDSESPVVKIEIEEKSTESTKPVKNDKKTKKNKKDTNKDKNKDKDEKKK